MLDALGPLSTGTLLAGDRMEYRLGSMFAEGGEGRIFSLVSREDVVAKLYKESDYRREAKLKRLIELSSKELRQVGAWPMSLLRSPEDEAVGFVMESLREWRPLHEVYQIRSRLRAMPNQTWLNVLRTARNLAAAVARIHGADLVIGDLNESNVLVDSKSMVKLIDIDSFQVRDGLMLFECKVGKSELLPPELQGHSLEGIVRTVEHDRFALAVLIFQTLVFGRHPFAGRPQGTSEIHTEEAITRGWYPFTQRRIVPLDPPPFLDLNWLPGSLRAMWEDAFDPSAPTRPSAEAWFEALRSLEKELASCPENSSHKHWSGCAKCPWCALEESWAITLFKPTYLHPSQGPSFDVDAVWQGLVSVTAPPISIASQLLERASADPVPAKLTRFQRVTCSLSRWPTFFFFFPNFINSLVGHKISSGLEGLVLSFMAMGLIPSFITAGMFNGPTRRVKKARRKLGHLKAELHLLPTEENYQWMLDEFSKIRDDLKNPADRLERLRQHMLEDRYGAQLDSYLNKYSVLAADATFIGSEKLSQLYDRGIRTAADMTEGTLRRNSRLELSQINHLMAWRRTLELQFWSTSGHQLTPAQEDELVRKIRKEDQQLRERLESGASELKALTAEINEGQRRFIEAIQPHVFTIEKEGPIAEAYLIAIGRKKRTSP